MKRAIATWSAALILVAAAFLNAQADPRPPSPGFRVEPYLQAPTATSMRLVWISERATPATVTVDGSGVPKKYISQPQYLDILEYSPNELTQEIKGLAKGSWLKSNSNYRHEVDVAGLKPNSSYTYTVTQDGIDFTASFRTPPTSQDWHHIRVAAFSDSETEPAGRVENREWEQNFANPYTPGSAKRPGEGSLWEKKFGSTVRNQQFTLKYPLTQDRAMGENLRAIADSNIDLMLVAGDLTQGSGYMPAWDEYWGYLAGEHGNLASKVPVLTALGNWETYAASSGGYGTPTDRRPVVRARNRYLEYIRQPGDPKNPAAKSSYYRTDHGPLTILTLDSTKGSPDEHTSTINTKMAPVPGDDTHLTPANTPTDTQGSFTYQEYVDAYLKMYPGSTSADVDLPRLNEGFRQYEWAREQLADARAKGQIILVQFHHVPYSIGVHGVPPNGTKLPWGGVAADNQSGVAMRAYSKLFEQQGVSAVISGHDEMFQRSFVDSDGDGVGFHVYDVGVAADGLRGELMATSPDGKLTAVNFNSHNKWSAERNAPETWKLDDNAVPQLVDGGLHYGHLIIDIKRSSKTSATITMSPVYLFPVLDSNYEVQRVERRVYNDVVSFAVDLPAGNPPPRPADPTTKPGGPAVPIRPPNTGR